MKRISKLLLIFIIFTTISCSIKNHTIEYYRHIVDQGDKPAIGRYQIDEESAKEVNCYRFSFDDNGKVINVEFLKEGKLHYDLQLVGVGAARILIEYLSGGSRISYENEFGEQVPNNEGIHIIRREIDRNKNQLLIANYNKEGMPAADSSGAYKYLVKFNKNGYPSNKYFLNEMGDTITGSLERYEIRYRYDERNNLIEEANYGKDGQLFEDEIGIAFYKYKYDIYGYCSEMRCYDIKGQLKENIKDGYCSVISEHDSKGNLTKADYLNLNGNTIIRIIYNTNWEISEMLFHISHPSSNKLADACIDYIHHVLGPHESVNETEYFNNKEQLKERCDIGIAIERHKRDIKGNIIEWSFFDAQDRLCERLDTGIAIMRFKYDKYGNIIESSTYGVEGALKTSLNNNFSIVRSKYNDLGHETERRFYGVYDELVGDRDNGAAILRWEYDEHGDIMKKVGLDKNENIVFEE